MTDSMTKMEQALGCTLLEAQLLAAQSRSVYITLEHMLLAMLINSEALSVLKASQIDIGKLEKNLKEYLAGEEALPKKDPNDRENPQPTEAYKRIISRAAANAREMHRDEIKTTDVLLKIFSEAQSPAVRFLTEQGLTQHDIATNIAYQAITAALPASKQNYDPASVLGNAFAQAVRNSASADPVMAGLKDLEKMDPSAFARHLGRLAVQAYQETFRGRTLG